MVVIKTIDPTGLLTAIKTEIKSGKIETWIQEAHNSIEYFTHSRVQWIRKAWLKPSVVANELHLAIVYPEGKPSDKVIAGVYHGRFIEMLCSHFNSKFSSILATLP